MPPKFQSFLIVGNREARTAQTAKLAKSFGTNLEKVSPDIFIITPQKNQAYTRETSISIDQIRELKSHIFQKPVKDQFKLVIIKEAEKLTTEAQNALLKILEEPPRAAILILETKNKLRLLPTILSRTVFIQAPEKSKAATISTSLNLLTERDVLKTLQELGKIEDPLAFLDSQIVLLNFLLRQAILKRKNGQRVQSVKKITAAIESCAATKEMIEANVNPRFALANLVFSLHLTL